MVNKFGKIDPQGLSRPTFTGLPTIEAGSHQERVYSEMFKAIELLGRRLEKSEEDRDRLARRLSLIESATAVDEKTGRLYLPALVDDMRAAPVSTAIPRWAIATSTVSMCVAFVALFLAFSQSGSQLTKEQLAVLDSIADTKIASLDNNSWRKVPSLETATAPAVASADTLGATAPSEDSLPQPTLMADATVQSQEDTATAPAVASVYTLGATAPSDDSLPQPTLMADTTVQPQEDVEETTSSIANANTAIENAANAIEPAASNAAAPVARIADQNDATARLARAVEAEERDANQPPVREDAVVDQTPLTEDAASNVVVQKPVTPASSEPLRTAMAKKREPLSGDAAVYSRIPADSTLPPDLAQLEKRAAEDVPEAQHDLATLYAAGRVVPQDYKRAVYWFSRAADGGIANAHYNLGVMFQQGLGVRKDVKKAVRWYKSASELGHPEAMYNLGISYIEGIGVARDIQKGAAYFRRAADAGVVQAAYNLGVLYESNFLGAADAGKAIEWYKKASDLGHNEARDAISRLQQAKAQALANQEPAAGQ